MNKKQILSIAISVPFFFLLVATPIKCRAQFGADTVHTINLKSLFAITGAVDHPFAISVSALESMPQTRVDAISSNRSVTYSGVLLKELLAKAGLSEKDANRLTLTAINQDNDPVTLSPESTQAVFKNGTRIIVADTANGKLLKGDSGPLMLIFPDDQPEHFVRNLARIRVETTK